MSRKLLNIFNGVLLVHGFPELIERRIHFEQDEFSVV
jgi:hypothetical protein